MEEKEEKNLQIRERESRRSGVWNDLRCEAGKSQKYRAERPYEIFLAELISCSRVFDSRRNGGSMMNPVLTIDPEFEAKCPLSMPHIYFP